MTMLKSFRPHLALSILLLFGGIMVLDGCKKGDNDPLISLRTRKQRLSGEWKMTEGTWSEADTTWTYDGTNLIKSVSGVAGDPLEVTYEYEFETDNKFKSSVVTNFPAGWFGVGTAAFTRTESIDGGWNWAGGDNDSRYKSKLLLLSEIIQTVNSNDGSNIDATNIEGQNEGIVYDLDELRHDKMVWKYDKDISTVTGIVSSEGTLTFEKQ